LSCAYHYGSHIGPEPVELLAGFGNFVVRAVGPDSCPSDAHKVADHPALAGLDDTYLSGWGCSTHEFFDSWPGSFQPLAIIQDATPIGTPDPYVADDGSEGYVYIVARGTASFCDEEHDTDGDCLTDTTEGILRTDPTDTDTDDDGLLDSWEVSEDVPGAGIRLPSGRVIERDEVFGPYANARNRDCDTTPDEELRLDQPFRCYNHRPNPLHKNVYLELDWQDCNEDYACPEVAGLEVDPLHHAPNIDGLLDVIDTFRRAPLENPDGTEGIVLSVLVDEAIPHEPNCDLNTSSVRDDWFGTESQRRSNAVIEAREMVFRYVWSGHSSDQEGDCPNPGSIDFIAQGVGLRELADYDLSPFGDANVGGRDILITLGPLWNCPSAIGDNGLGNNGPCYREIQARADITLSSFLTDAGIFPARVADIDWHHPVSRLLGERELDASRQLWARSLMRLLGRSLGIPYENEVVGNEPAPGGRVQSGEDNPLTPLPPDSYSSWSDVTVLAPDGLGVASFREDDPDYATLAFEDPDDDGVVEHDDNCPGVHNPDQDNTDFGPWYAFGNGPNVLEFGDACEPDIDGDGDRNPMPGEGERVGAFSLTAVSDVDPFPYDTDNDGEDNDVDADDDGDGVPDGVDLCRIHPDPEQVDTDGDALGDVCDIDLDGDAFENVLELRLGSDLRSAASTLEVLGWGDTCTNGVDDDADGAADAGDDSCTDEDGDTAADSYDNCLGTPNTSQIDLDDDGIGDACQPHVEIRSLSSRYASASTDLVEVGWGATAPTSFSVRVGGSDCSSGVVADSGAYDPGVEARSLTAFSPIPVSALVEGANVIRVCATIDGQTVEDTTEVVLDSTAPETTILAGPDEAGTSGPNVVFELDADEPARFRCALDDAPMTDCDDIAAFAGLTDGPHRLEVVAVDRAGNTDPTPVVRTWMVGVSGYPFAGFFAPVDNPPVTNAVRAGTAVPVRFSLGGDEGLDVLADGSPYSRRVACETGAPADEIEETVAPGGSSLQYDAATDTYTYVWKTNRAWGGTCRQLTVRFDDGSAHAALFELR
jgi:hypothetical protein